jgi:hypothetical protein
MTTSEGSAACAKSGSLGRGVTIRGILRYAQDDNYVLSFRGGAGMRGVKRQDAAWKAALRKAALRKRRYEKKADPSACGPRDDN